MVFLTRTKISRRKFLYVGIGAAVALGSGLAIKEYVFPQLFRLENKYPQGLSIELKVSDEVLEYPPIKSNMLDLTIDIRNITQVPIENITLKFLGLKGFEFRSAKYQGKVLDVSGVNNSGDLAISIPDSALGAGWVREIQLTYEPGYDSQTSNIVTQANGEYFQEGKFGYGSGYLETVSNQVQTTIQVIPLPKTLAELHQQGQQDWVREILDRKILLQYPTSAELQEKYWRDPNEKNSQEVVEYLYAELEKNGEPFLELVTELHKLPDLRNPKYDVDLVKAIENIASICLLYDVPKDNIQKMLDEGIKEKRKYCTPLQALFWLAVKEPLDKEFNPLNPYGVKQLLSISWYSSNEPKDAWKDFNSVTSRLNSPICVYLFMLRNFRYDGSVHGWQSPSVTFNKKSGHCADQSEFGVYSLVKNGYKAYNFWIKWGSGWFDQHTVCLFKEKNGRIYYLDTASPSNVGIHGPFTSISDVASSMMQGMPSAGPVQEHGFWDVSLNRSSPMDFFP